MTSHHALCPGSTIDPQCLTTPDAISIGSIRPFNGASPLALAARNALPRRSALGRSRMAERDVIVIKGSQDNNLRFRIFFPKAAGSLYTIHHRHADVHPDQVRLPALIQLDGLKSINRLANLKTN